MIFWAGFVLKIMVYHSLMQGRTLPTELVRLEVWWEPPGDLVQQFSWCHRLQPHPWQNLNHMCDCAHSSSRKQSRTKSHTMTGSVCCLVRTDVVWTTHSQTDWTPSPTERESFLWSVRQRAAERGRGPRGPSLCQWKQTHPTHLSQTAHKLHSASSGPFSTGC